MGVRIAKENMLMGKIIAYLEIQGELWSITKVKIEGFDI